MRLHPSWFIVISSLAAAGCAEALETDPAETEPRAVECSAHAPLDFGSAFGPHMVLHRHQPRIEGTGHPGDTVEVTLADAAPAQTTVGPQGRWQIDFPDTLAPGNTTIVASDSCSEAVLEDVALGQAWLCTGQSNMAHRLATEWSDAQEHSLPFADLLEHERQLLLAEAPEIQDWVRILHVAPDADANPLDDFAPPQFPAFQQSWSRPSWSDARYFSAVCWHFGRRLAEELSEPIGLVQAAYGGTKIQGWMPVETIRDEYSSSSDEHEQLNDAALYNAMIHPLLGGRYAGVLWYQGESSTELRSVYDELLTGMIDAWRERFEAASLPFFVVQLAGQDQPPLTPQAFVPGAEVTDVELQSNPYAVADLRHQQYVAASQTPGVSVVAALGTMVEGVVDGRHPMDKLTLSQRLARSALAVVYGQPQDDLQPRWHHNKTHVKYGKLYLQAFLPNRTPEQMPSVGDALDGFLLRDDGSASMTMATARVHATYPPDDTGANDGRMWIEVSAPDVVQPVEVRYQWHINPSLGFEDGGEVLLPFCASAATGWSLCEL